MWFAQEVLLEPGSGMACPYALRTVQDCSAVFLHEIISANEQCKSGAGRSTGGGCGEDGKRATLSVQSRIINVIFLLLIWPIYIILLLQTSCWISHSLFYRLPVAISPTSAYAIYHLSFKTLHSFEWIPELLVPLPTHCSLPFSPSAPGNQQLGKTVKAPTYKIIYLGGCKRFCVHTEEDQ